MSKSSRFTHDHYRLILDSISEGICTVDPEWNITSFNRAAQNLTGVPEDEALSLSFGDIFRCEVCECKSLLSGVLETGEPIVDVDTRIMNRKGEPVPVCLNAALFRNDSGGIEGLVAVFRDNRQIETLRKELRRDFTYGDIVSKNNRILRILDILPDIAESDSSVLILGPSGTGKELLARAIHNASPRSDRTFVAVNCGALPDNLLESELFGYKKGAFTDARRDKPGRFDLAEGGTLFLDEIGDVSPAMQVKLLRVLQEKQYEPLGATMAVNSDVRVLAATNRNLTEMVSREEFRADLYYRLNVIQLELPSLSERPEDIPLLVEHFIEKLNAEKGRNIRKVSPQAMRRLMRYDYPGNIRELRNAIERACVMCRGDEIQEQCLPPHLLGSPAKIAPCTKPTAAEQVFSLRSLSAKDEKSLILRTLQECNGNRRITAERLSINPSTLWRKMKKYQIL